MSLFPGPFWPNVPGPGNLIQSLCSEHITSADIAYQRLIIEAEHADEVQLDQAEKKTIYYRSVLFLASFEASHL